jgi:hypothetical protein
MLPFEIWYELPIRVWTLTRFCNPQSHALGDSVHLQAILVHTLSLDLIDAGASLTASLTSYLLRYPILLVSDRGLVPCLLSAASHIVIHTFKISHFGLKIVQRLSFLFF